MAGLVGHQHPSVFHLVSILQQDAALAETVIIQDARTWPGTSQAAAKCRAAASVTAVLRRPRWPQDCAGDHDRTLWDIAFVFFEQLLRTLYTYDTIISAFCCIIMTLAPNPSYSGGSYSYMRLI